jgi:hypothetical protein
VNGPSETISKTNEQVHNLNHFDPRDLWNFAILPLSLNTLGGH